MSFPSKADFANAAYRSAWFTVDTIIASGEAVQHTCQPFDIQTEGLQAVIEIQRAAREELKQRKQRGPIEPRQCGGRLIQPPGEVYVSGRFDENTAAALITLTDEPANNCGDVFEPRITIWGRREVPIELLLAGLNLWVRNSATIQGEMQRVLSARAAARRASNSRILGDDRLYHVIGCAVQSDATMPFWGEAPSVPRHILAPSVTIEAGVECGGDDTAVV